MADQQVDHVADVPSVEVAREAKVVAAAAAAAVVVDTDQTLQVPLPNKLHDTWPPLVVAVAEVLVVVEDHDLPKHHRRRNRNSWDHGAR